MKATELMIGDYVLVKPSMMLIKVAAVHHKKVGYHAVTHKLNWVRMDLEEPIPLTAEILERNGFEYTDAWAEWWHRSEDGFGSDFQLSITESGFSMKDIGNAKINFVHQLQHALRLCGLDELADNFKLEE